MEKQGVPPESTFVGLPETAARPLIAIRDEEIKGKVLLSVKNSLESGKNPITGQFTSKPLDSRTVEQVIEKATNGNIHFSSETNEWYTPKEILESVVNVFGQISIYRTVVYIPQKAR